MHRFVWDLHYARPAGMSASYPISAVYRNTVKEPLGVWALPGSYSVRLKVDGKSYSRPLRVRMDPRVKTPVASLQQQFSLSKRLSDAIGVIATRLASGTGDRAALTRINANLENLYNLLQDADVPPTAQAIRAANEALAAAR